MKFQNCILINFVTNARRDAQTDKPKAICPFNFSKVGGIMTSVANLGAILRVKCCAIHGLMLDKVVVFFHDKMVKFFFFLQKTCY